MRSFISRFSCERRDDSVTDLRDNFIHDHWFAFLRAGQRRQDESCGGD